MKKLYHTFPKVVGSEITSEKHLFNRRNIIAGIGSSMWLAKPSSGQSPTDPSTISTIPSKVSGTSIIDQPTPFEDATSYNNYYEFGLDKESPKKNAQKMSVSPWEIQMEGLVKKPGTWTLEQLLKLAPMEERIYRLRCVEGWSMVIPWVGYSLSNLIQKLEPLGQAKYVSFETLSDKKTMPYINSRVLQWPYIEGLRLDEAMHPLTLLTFGMYGKLLPNQNGAPLRLVVPWKYG
ncbi:MAG: protein-methionine-sulfoxide reductase catalytic subunit MsrP, partial [Gammaproteobacteria bacterium]|nr:protein-methionine-sulfoxide reductase catalytic subunit MsrP [Gammaproteobacteria bacterium]